MTKKSESARDYAEPVVLRDGGSLLMRAVRPTDKPQLLELFRSLSPDSIRYRTFGAKSTLSEAELRYLTELDFVQHVAIAAVRREGAEEHIIGVGRYVRSSKSGAIPTRAEVAFEVADAYQGHGIGTLLLEHIAAIARASGIEELEAYVLLDNARMMEVFAESGFIVRESMEEGIYHVVFPTSASPAFLRASMARERHAAAESVRVFFEPSSVAVVGASRSQGGIGHAILSNLRRCGYAGPIYPINPQAAEIDGLRAYATVSEVPAKVDLSVIAVPAAHVEGVLLDCARAHVRGVVVISSGFGEIGGEGKALQKRLVRLARAAGMRLIGPNCMGVLNASPSVSLNASFAPTWPPAGNVSMLSQSGALGVAMLDHVTRLNIGLAGFVSVGNKADVSGNDLISYWADDDATKVIALYLESFGNPRKFARIAPEVARKKPIIAVKSGRSAAGKRAAASHTAALISLDVGVDALFEQAGVIRTTTLEELFDVAALLSTQPLPPGARVGVVTNAGGPGILLADACEAHGLTLPVLEKATLDALRSVLPRDAGLLNPIDMLASATPEHYLRTIEIVGNDRNVDALVAIYIPPLVTRPEEVASAIAAAAGRIPPEKPIATVFMSSKGTPPMLSTGPRGKIPSYSFPENAALALASAARYARWRSRPRGSIVTLPREALRAIRLIVDRLVAANHGSFWAPPRDLAAILEHAGVRLAALAEVGPTAEEAAAAANEIGYPVVVKAVAPGLVHKTEVGGVIVGIEDEAGLREAVSTLSMRLHDADHTLSGIVVQRQIEGGLEAIVGVATDPAFGPLLVAGLGGVAAEVLRDVATRLTPVSDLDASEMVSGLRAAKLLDGYRGAPAVDRAAFEAIVMQVSALVEAVPEIVELELNPVKLLPLGQGAVPVDARMLLCARP